MGNNRATTTMKTIDTLTMEELENKIYEFGKTIKEAHPWVFPFSINEENNIMVFHYFDDDEFPYYSFCEFLREMGQIFGFEVEKIEFCDKEHMDIYTTLSAKRYYDLLRKHDEKCNEESANEEAN